MAWRMVISEGGVITGFLTCVEIGSASYSGGMRGWRYIEWQYNEGTLYFISHDTKIVIQIHINSLISGAL
jgi:hypothetical protein